MFRNKEGVVGPGPAEQDLQYKEEQELIDKKKRTAEETDFNAMVDKELTDVPTEKTE